MAMMMPMIVTTISSSISVNPRWWRICPNPERHNRGQGECRWARHVIAGTYRHTLNTNNNSRHRAIDRKCQTVGRRPAFAKATAGLDVARKKSVRAEAEAGRAGGA